MLGMHGTMCSMLYIFVHEYICAGLCVGDAFEEYYCFSCCFLYSVWRINLVETRFLKTVLYILINADTVRAVIRCYNTPSHPYKSCQRDTLPSSGIRK